MENIIINHITQELIKDLETLMKKHKNFIMELAGKEINETINLQLNKDESITTQLELKFNVNQYNKVKSIFFAFKSDIFIFKFKYTLSDDYIKLDTYDIYNIYMFSVLYHNLKHKKSTLLSKYIDNFDYAYKILNEAIKQNYGEIK